MTDVHAGIFDLSTSTEDIVCGFDHADPKVVDIMKARARPEHRVLMLLEVNGRCDVGLARSEEDARRILKIPAHAIREQAHAHQLVDIPPTLEKPDGSILCAGCGRVKMLPGTAKKLGCMQAADETLLPNLYLLCGACARNFKKLLRRIELRVYSDWPKYCANRLIPGQPLAAFTVPKDSFHYEDRAWFAKNPARMHMLRRDEHGEPVLVSRTKGALMRRPLSTASPEVFALSDEPAFDAFIDHVIFGAMPPPQSQQ